MTDIQQRSYTYNNGNELLTQNGTSFTFDANGNMVSKTDSTGTTSYVYDSENRLVQLTTPNAQLVTYKYDPFGRRIEKSVTDTVTGTVTVKRYVYDREDILFELDGNGNIITEYLHGPGIDEPIAMIKNNQTYYYHADGLGSIVAITDCPVRLSARPFLRCLSYFFKESTVTSNLFCPKFSSLSCFFVFFLLRQGTFSVLLSCKHKPPTDTTFSESNFSPP